METAKLTIRLPREDIDFAKAYAKRHGLSVTEVINRHLQRLRAGDDRHFSPAVQELAGLLPDDLDIDAERRRHLQHKHGG